MQRIYPSLLTRSQQQLCRQTLSFSLLAQKLLSNCAQHLLQGVLQHCCQDHIHDIRVHAYACVSVCVCVCGCAAWLSCLGRSRSRLLATVLRMSRMGRFLPYIIRVYIAIACGVNNVPALENCSVQQQKQHQQRQQQ